MGRFFFFFFLMIIAVIPGLAWWQERYPESLTWFHGDAVKPGGTLSPVPVIASEPHPVDQNREQEKELLPQMREQLELLTRQDKSREEWAVQWEREKREQADALATLREEWREKWEMRPKEPPLRLESGALLAKRDDAEWRLEDLLNRRRVLQREVRFVTPFTTPPHVVMGITQIDVGQEGARFQVWADKISEEGFVAVFETRSDARLRELRADWLAFGQ